MPYRRYKRSYGKKKSFRRKTIRKRMTYRRRRNQFTKPDGNHREKIERIAYFMPQNDLAELSVHWLATGASANIEMFHTGGVTGGTDNTDA